MVQQMHGCSCIQSSRTWSALVVTDDPVDGRLCDAEEAREVLLGDPPGRLQRDGAQVELGRGRTQQGVDFERPAGALLLEVPQKSKPPYKPQARRSRYRTGLC